MVDNPPLLHQLTQINYALSQRRKNAIRLLRQQYWYRCGTTRIFFRASWRITGSSLAYSQKSQMLGLRHLHKYNPLFFHIWFNFWVAFLYPISIQGWAFYSYLAQPPISRGPQVFFFRWNFFFVFFNLYRHFKLLANKRLFIPEILKLWPTT